MENNDYLNIDFRLNVLFDAVYNETNNECYKFDPISKQNISLIDIKEPADFDCSIVFDKCSLKFIEYSNKRFHFKRASDSTYPCTVSIGKYENEQNINDLSSNELMNIGTMYILSELVISDKIKNILLPIMFFDLDMNDLNENMISVLKEKFNESDKLYCLVTEHYFKMDTLRSFINNNKNITLEQWKSICFQILFTLYKITERLPEFRHNMLNIDSIKIYKKKEGYLKENYILKKENYEILTAGLEIKFSDFDKSYIKGYHDNKNNGSAIVADDENIENFGDDNPYQDVYHFFNNLNNYLTKIEYAIPQEFKNFINQIISKQKDIILPINIIINDTFFKNFVENNIVNNSEISTMDIKKEKISRLNNMTSSVSYSNSESEISNIYTDKLLKKNIKSYNKNMARIKNSGGKPKKGSNELKGIARLAEKMHDDNSDELSESEPENLNRMRNEVNYKHDTEDNKHASELKNVLGRLNKIRKNKKSRSKSNSKGKKSSRNQSGGDSSEYSASYLETDKPAKSKQNFDSDDSMVKMFETIGSNDPIPDDLMYKYMSRGGMGNGSSMGMPGNNQPQQGSLAEYMMPQGMPGMMPQGMPGMMPQGMPGGMMPQGMPDMMPQGMPDMTPQGMPGMTPQGMPGMMPQEMPGMMPQGMPGMMPQGMSGGMMPQGMPGMIPQGMHGMMPQGMPDKMPQGMPGMMPHGMSDTMSQGMPDKMPQSGGSKTKKYTFYNNSNNTKLNMNSDFFF